MQRVRIGLTGLAFVFLVVLMAAVFTSQSNEEAPITANSIEQQRLGNPPPAPAVSAKAKEKQAPSDPLAELGVAPGNADANSAATSPGAAADDQPPQ